jgi:hypothetical protein
MNIEEKKYLSYEAEEIEGGWCLQVTDIQTIDGVDVNVQHRFDIDQKHFDAFMNPKNSKAATITWVTIKEQRFPIKIGGRWYMTLFYKNLPLKNKLRLQTKLTLQI